MADQGGLSILIPVFNCDVTKLVWQLVEQAADWPGPVSIDLLDDGSSRAFRLLNAQVADWPLVRYQKLPRNIGRAAIRNQLASNAQHEWLLLLDNDSYLPDSQFLRRYTAALGRASVVIGGTCYRSTPPADPALYLRWLYGQEREARPAAVRQAAPYSQLTINNALIQAAVLRQFPLDERLTGYGHEDTKFGVELAAAQVPVLHLDNPVLHEGLEPAAVFLQKTEQAVHNLVQVYRQNGLGTDSRLLQTVLRLRSLKLARLAAKTLAIAAPRLRRQLLSAKPHLRALDLLKLHWLLQELA
jgi:glycosyltransferase involved in cell wall biosynthesis